MKYGMLKLSVALVVITSFVAGFVSASNVEAVNEITLRIHAGTSAGTAMVTCGWHGECTDPPTSGNALDWAQSGGVAVYLSSYGYYSGPVQVNAGTAQATQRNGSCKRVALDVKRLNGTALGTLYYSHSDVYFTGTFVLNAAPLPESQYWPSAKTQVRIATTASSELQGTCVNRLNPNPPPTYLQDLWSGPHLHQYAGSPYGSNTAVYPTAPGTLSNVDVMSITKYTHYVTYQY